MVVPLALACLAAQPDSLSYINRSPLFASPKWEIGRSIFAIADINLDGHPDVLSVGDHGSPLFGGSQLAGVSVWLSDGNNAFTFQQTGDFGYGGIAVGDVNNDALPDIAYGVHHNWSATDLGDQVLEVALGNATGLGWAPWDDNLGLQGQTWGMFGCALADFNSDGWLDLASNAFGCCDGIHAYLNNTDGSWTPTLTQLNGNSDMEIEVGDFNNDGVPDLLTSHQHASVWLGDGAGGFTPWDVGLPGSSGFLGRIGATAGDFDRDGRDDIAYCPGNGGIQAWRSAPTGWIKASDGLPQPPSAAFYSRALLRDLDADGDLDLVAYRDLNVEFYLGDGSGAWSFDGALPVPTPGVYSALAAADLDHNARPDILILTRESTGGLSTKNVLKYWTEATPTTGPSMLITSPPPHRAWIPGSVVFVEWQAAGTRPVDLSISRFGPEGPWTTIATDLPPSGRHQVVVQGAWAGPSVHVRASLGGPDGARDIVGPLSILGAACYPDCDASGALDLFDFLCFQDAFSCALPYADCDESGAHDLFDYLCFQGAFAIGCR